LCSITFCSYHQKYILQKHDWLMAALKLCRGKQLIMSSVAARVNGYVGGYGDKVGSWI
jgi:hypothetical protein